MSLPNLPARIISARALTGGDVDVIQEDGRLTVSVAKQHDFNTVVALELDQPAMELPVVDSVGDSLTLDSTASASSEGEDANKPAPAANVVATTATDFDQGAFVRAVWRPKGEDKQPWLQIDFGEERTVSQLEMMEGKVGQSSTIKAFTVSARKGDGWEVVHTGSSVGHQLGIILKAPVTTDALRFDFQDFVRKVSLNAVNAY